MIHRFFNISVTLLFASCESRPTPTAIPPTATRTPTHTPTQLVPTSTPSPTSTPIPALTRDHLSYVNLGLPTGDSYIPIAVAADIRANRVYVYSSYNNEDGQDTLSVLEADSLEIIRNIPLGGRKKSPSLASQLLVDPTTHRIYTLNGDSRELWVLDSESVRPVMVIDGAHAMALAPEAQRIYLINHAGYIVALSTDNYSRIAETDQTGGFQIQFLAYNLANDGLYLAKWDFSGAGSIVVLDGTTLARRTEIRLPSVPYDLTINAQLNEIYVATAGGITVVDGVTNQIAANLNLHIAQFQPSRNLTLDPQTHRLFLTYNSGLALSSGGELVVIDAVNRSEVHRTRTPHFWRDIIYMPDRKSLLAIPAVNDALVVTDDRGKIQQRVMLGIRILDMQTQPGPGHLWAVDSAGIIHVLENSGVTELGRSGEIIGNGDGAVERAHLAVTENSVYVADLTRDSTLVLGTDDLTVRQEIPVAGPLAIDWKGQRLFVASGDILLFGLGSGQPIGRISTGLGDEHAVLDLLYEVSSSRLYVKMKKNAEGFTYQTSWQVYDGRTLELSSSLDPENRDAGRIATVPQANWVFLTYQGISTRDRGLLVYDPSGIELTRIVGFDGQLVASPDGRYLFALRQTGIWALDRRTLDVVALLPLTESYEQMVVDPQGEWLYLSNLSGIAVQSVERLLKSGIRPLRNLPQELSIPPSIHRSPAFDKDQTAYAIVPGSGIFRSEDGENTWYSVNKGLRNLFVDHLEFSPDFPASGTMSVTAGSTKYVSADRGDTWTTASPR